MGDVPTDPQNQWVVPDAECLVPRAFGVRIRPAPLTKGKSMNKRTENEPVEVKWDNEPLDVALERHGCKRPDRKVKVRGILRDDWLEQEADLEPGSVHRLVEAIKKALRHGYEPRMDESVRFVHLVDANFANMRVSVQPMGPFRGCLEGVSFRLRYEGREMSSEEAKELRDQGTGNGEQEESEEVSPDQMITCPKCHKRFRVGKKMGC